MSVFPHRPGGDETVSVGSRIGRAFGVLAATMAAMVAVALLSLGVLLGVVSPAINRAGDAANAVATSHAGMLNQETGLRGWLLTGDRQFLEPYQQGLAQVATGNRELSASGDPAGRSAEAGLIAAQQRWEQRLGDLPTTTQGLPSQAAITASLLDGKAAFDAYRLEEAGVAARIDSERKHLVGRMTDVGILAVVIESAFAAVGIYLFHRRHQLEKSIVLPMKSLLESVGSVAAGHLDAPVPIGGPLELQALGAGLQSLIDEVAARRGDLEAANEVLGTESLRLAGIVAAQQAIATGSTSAEDCRSAVCTRAQLAVGADGAVMELLDGDALVHHSGTGILAPFDGMRIPLKGSLAGLCLSESRILASQDTSDDSRVDPVGCARMNIRSIVVVPLRQADGVMGVLKVASSCPSAFTSADLATLELMAPLASSQLSRTVALESLALTNQALAVAEERSRRLAALSPDAVVIVDDQEHIVYANREAAVVLGVASADALADADAGVYFSSGDVRDRRRQAVLIDHTVVHGSLEEVCNKQGETLPIEISSAPYEHDGRVAVLSVFRDISDRMAAEMALAASEARWRSAFEAAPVGVIEIDSRGRFIEVNAAFCELIGQRRERLCGASIDVVSPPHDPVSPRLNALSSQPGKIATLRAELQLVHSGGQLVWVDLSATVLPGTRGLAGRRLCHVVNIAHRKQAESELQHLADHDPLTGLRNRRSFSLALTEHAARVGRYGPQGALMVMDLDRFKDINDTLGHHTGDTALVAMADALRSQLRNTDVIARIGGDEFAVILPFLDYTGAQVVAAKLVAAIRTELPVAGTDSLAVTTSLGVAFFDDAARSGEDVLASADLMMYASKRSGGNRFTLPPSTVMAMDNGKR